MGKVSLTPLLVSVAACLCGFAYGQDELALFAQGGQGGVAGDPGDAEFTTKTHILTPGQTGEWEFNAKPNDCVWATASSQAFDPAIEVLDGAGKILVSNDDIAPGVQEARVLVRFPKEGKYKLLVKGFKGVAGGQYEITFRQFSVTGMGLTGETGGRKGRDDSPNVWVALDLKKSQPVSVTMIGAHARGLEVMAPAGAAPDGLMLASPEGRNARLFFRPPSDGTYFFRFGVNREVDYKVVARQILELAAPPTGPVSLDGFSCALVSIPVQPTQAYQVGLATSAGVASLDFPAFANPVVRNLPRFYSIESRAKTPNQARFVARTDQPCVAVVTTPVGTAGTFEMSVTNPARPLMAPATGKMAIGDMDFYRVDCTAGQVVRLNAGSTEFDAMLVVKNQWGQQIGSSGDKTGLDPGMTLAISETGPIYVGVASEGNGGGGSYTVSCAEAETAAISPGKSNASTGRGAGDPAIWKVDGRKGQTVLVNVRSGESAVRAIVYGPDGRALIEVGNDRGRAEGGRVFVLPADGSYTVWAWCDSGRAYSLQWFDTDSG